MMKKNKFSLNQKLLALSLIISIVALIISGLNFLSYRSLQGESNKMTGEAIEFAKATEGLNRFDSFIKFQNEVCNNDSDSNLQTNKELYMEAQENYFNEDYNITLDKINNVNTTVLCLLTGSFIKEEKVRVNASNLLVTYIFIILTIGLIILIKKRK